MDIYSSFELGLMKDFIKQHHLLLLWLALTFLQGHKVNNKAKSSTFISSQAFSLIWLKTSILLQPNGSLKPILNLFRNFQFQRERWGVDPSSDTSTKNLHWHTSLHFSTDFNQIQYDKRYCQTLQFDVSMIKLGFHSRSQGNEHSCKKKQNPLRSFSFKLPHPFLWYKVCRWNLIACWTSC